MLGWFVVVCEARETALSLCSGWADSGTDDGRELRQALYNRYNGKGESGDASIQCQMTQVQDLKYKAGCTEKGHGERKRRRRQWPRLRRGCLERMGLDGVRLMRKRGCKQKEGSGRKDKCDSIFICEHDKQ